MRNYLVSVASWAAGFLLLAPLLIHGGMFFGMVLTHMIFPLTLGGILVKVICRFLAYAYYYPGLVLGKLFAIDNYWADLDKGAEGWIYYPGNLPAILLHISSYLAISVILVLAIMLLGKMLSR